MTIICNATPLINFAAIDRLDLLQVLFGQVLIPQAVYNETTVLGFSGTQAVLQAIDSGWLQVYPAPVANLPATLDDGEREAIALALTVPQPRILLDEQEARRVAQGLGLQVMGTLGILLLAKENQVILQVRSLLDAMIQDAQYWVSASLYEQLLHLAGEKD